MTFKNTQQEKNNVKEQSYIKQESLNMYWYMFDWKIIKEKRKETCGIKMRSFKI